LLVPTYLFALVCYALPGALARPALPDRWVGMAVVTVFTFALYRAGVVRSLLLQERQQRAWPLLLATVSFGAAALLLHRPAVFDPLLAQMMLGMTLAVLLAYVVTLRWKISAHAMGMGGALGLLALLGLQELTVPEAAFLIVIMLMVAAAVSWARLALRAHTKAQVAAGLSAGLGIVFVLAAYCRG
jgi:membrane-associated phospholipid phosphatase